MKRILSFLTAVVMLLSLSVVGVSAAPEDFQYTVHEGAATVTAYTGSGGDVQMDETLGGVPVTAVVYSAFNANTAITGMVFPSGVSQMEDATFSGCTGLTSFSVAENSVLSEIGGYAFAGCTSLTDVQLPQTVTSIGAGAFAGCTTLENITLPNGVTSVGVNTFRGDTALKKVVLPETLQTIVYGMFDGCSALSDIYLPESVTSIEQNAFDGCTSLGILAVGEQVTNIAPGAFDNHGENLQLLVKDGSTAYLYAITYGIPYTTRNCDEDGHLWGEWTVVQEGSCADGTEHIEQRTCLACGETEERRTPVEHQMGTRVIVPATYTAPGQSETYCTVCGTVLSTDEIPVLNIEDRLADVANGQWFTPFIAYCLDEGLMSGQDEYDGNGREYFRPDSTMTRAELVTVLYNMEGKPAVEVEPIFNDVAAGQGFAGEGTWAAQNEIVYGTSPTEFSPNAPISRQDLAAILHRYAVNYKGLDLTVEDPEQQLSAFVDVDQIATHGWMPLAALNKAGVITGDGDRLKPLDSASRGEVASMINRFIVNVLEATEA